MVSDLMSIVREEDVVLISWEMVQVIHMGEVKEINLSLAVGLASIGMLVIKSSHYQIMVQVPSSSCSLFHCIIVELRVWQVDGG